MDDTSREWGLSLGHQRGPNTATSGDLATARDIVKKDGLPVTFTNDPTVEAAAIREVDLEKKFHMGPYDLADKAGVDRTKSVALRRHLGLDNDDDHHSHVFKFGNTSHRRYSNNALDAMRQAKEALNLEKVWQAHRTIPSNQMQVAPPCDQPGCAAT